MTRGVRFSSGVLAAALTLAACGGGGGTSSMPPGPSQGKTSSLAFAALSFFIPSASSSNARARRPSYLPAATQSIVVNVSNADGTPTNPPTAPTVVNVSSSSCAAVSGGEQCTVTVTVPFGSLLFAIAAYAQQNGAGALLSSSTSSATIGSGPNNVAVSMSAQTLYVGTGLNGNKAQTVTIDHQAGTFTVNSGGTSSGTFAPLPNGDLKATITAATSGAPIGSVAYIREIANGALMYVATGATTPNPGGDSPSNADFGMLTAAQQCPTANASFAINAIAIAGPNFPSVVSSHEAYTTGTATIANGTLNFAGTSYTLAGTNLGTTPTQPSTCANGVFTDSSSGSVVYDPQGFVVVNSGPNQGTNPSQYGNFAFRAPAQPFDLPTLASKSYEGYSAGFVPNGPSSTVNETPFFATPGANGLTACPYVNFEMNAVGTSGCLTLTFSAQPFPGIITGTATGGTNTASFVAVVGQVNGKYLITLLGSQSGGSAVNMGLMQQ